MPAKRNPRLPDLSSGSGQLEAAQRSAMEHVALWEHRADQVWRWPGSSTAEHYEKSLANVAQLKSYADAIREEWEV